MGLLELLLYPLLILLLFNLLQLLSLLWLVTKLVMFAIAIILRRLKFPRNFNVEKFLDSPIAHRCGTPENSLDGIKWCKHHGAVAVEMDLNLTKDDIPVLFHDDISHSTFEEAKMANGSIPTLYEALELCKELNLTVFLDVKAMVFVLKTVDVIKNLYSDDQSLYDRMIICSFSPMLLVMTRIADHKISVAITHRSDALTFDLEGNPRVYKHVLLNLFVPYIDWFVAWSIHTWFVDLLGISLMLVHKDDLSKYYVEKWMKKNVHILAWTVNNKHEQLFCEEVLKVTYMTDHPGS